MLKKQVAFDLGITEKTIKVHRGRALKMVLGISRSIRRVGLRKVNTGARVVVIAFPGRDQTLFFLLSAIEA